MVELIRTNSSNQDFIELVANLDMYLKIVDGDDHNFYNQYNGLESLKHVVVAYSNKQPVGCGAFKEYNTGTVEIKRMYVNPTNRDSGIASKILKELEDWSRELNYTKSILETGLKQVEAINFYKKNNYYLIPNYEQYKGVENSLCFEKNLELN